MRHVQVSHLPGAVEEIARQETQLVPGEVQDLPKLVGKGRAFGTLFERIDFGDATSNFCFETVLKKWSFKKNGLFCNMELF